ncbi:hypothetical protein [Cupriavidus pinatubonensis]|uniref:Uncharacterized protein n=1 Tax=Cupriavidus pinatubonensis TaxID=248026 RepID=A0ABM8Y3X4_9BURK|nr:hypothetical protein [Cupriavidus pinatubonensis]CAG9187480.1 hypothetical protein LMG23994_06925 [Cupriavidus pinatubonensis]
MRMFMVILSLVPYLYLNLPRGDYRAVIRYGGSIVSRSIAVTGKGVAADILLRLPAIPAGSDGLIARPGQWEPVGKSK